MYLPNKNNEFEIVFKYSTWLQEKKQEIDCWKITMQHVSNNDANHQGLALF